MSQFLQTVRNSPTFRLRKKHPNFIDGFVEILNVANGIYDNYNTNSTDELADRQALESDWKAVGIDMYSALAKYDKKPRGN